MKEITVVTWTGHYQQQVGAREKARQELAAELAEMHDNVAATLSHSEGKDLYLRGMYAAIEIIIAGLEDREPELD